MAEPFLKRSPRGYEPILKMHLARGQKPYDICLDIMKLILYGEEQDTPPFRWKSKRGKDVCYFFNPQPPIDYYTYGSSFDILDDEDGLTPYGCINLDYLDGPPIRARVKKEAPSYANSVSLAPYQFPTPNPQLFYKVLSDFATFLYSRFSSRIIFFELTPY